MQLRLEEEKIGAGKTKEAFKAYIGDSTMAYAAKRFYYIGGNSALPVTNDDNVKNLKEELVRQKIAQQSLTKFHEQIKAKKVNAYDLRIANAFLLTVTEGPDRGLSWLVDPLLDSSSNIIKFSGTIEAGHNKDLMGMTCDAFAHFSLYDSSKTCVFVDIQGIHGKDRANGRLGVNILTLFDLMAHSKDKQMGLGDKGIEGIQEFKSQHTYNYICKELRLPDTGAPDQEPEDDMYEEDELDSDQESCKRASQGELGNEGRIEAIPNL